MFIYLIVNHATGKYYVGQHKGSDLKKYLQQKFSDARHDRGSSHLFRSMRKHPLPCDWSIHALLSDVQTRTELDQYEKDFISFLRSQDPEYGYNICRGGEGFTGPCSEQTKQKLRTAILGRKHTPEAIARMKAIPRTEKQLVSLNQTGRKRSPETVEKFKNRTKELNSQFGTCWIRSGGLEKKVKKESVDRYFQQGWVRGRTINVQSAVGDKINGVELLLRVDSKWRTARWLCRCHCGNVFTTGGSQLRNGHTKSCGCLCKKTQFRRGIKNRH